MTIDGRPATPSQVQTEVSEASTAWARERRPSKPDAPRRVHRTRSQDEKEAKVLATATARKRREEEREARELDKLLARIRYLSRRSERESQAMKRVRVSWSPSAEPRITSVCPHKLYTRLHPEISDRVALARKPSRVAGDGFKNIVLRKTSRGYGRKAAGTRDYSAGEAADLARYILREDALEPEIQSCFTNILNISGEHALQESDELTIDNRRCAQLVGFWNALEAFEAEADADGNVYSHLILAMPHELSPEGRSKALEDFCFRLDALSLPYVAGLHRPDEKGDARNFHAHILVAPRPFAIEGAFAWSFEAAKATEINLPAGVRWLRAQAAEAFNHALRDENLALRYSGLSQAERNVPSTGEAHDGPIKTARMRREQEDQAERDRLIGLLAHRLAAADKRQEGMARRIVEATLPKALPKARAAIPAAALPPGLAALRKKFPDPLKLRGLSMHDLTDFTPADDAADRWYGPALNLAADIRHRPERFVIDRDGKAELIADALGEKARGLLEETALPDIVQEALLHAHRQLLENEVSRKRRAREEEKLRRARISWLRGPPTLLFDERMNVLPRYRPMFPPQVVAMEGVKQAMFDCHIPALRLKRQRDEEARARADAEASLRRFPRLPITNEPVKSPADEEDADWDLIRQAYQAGKDGSGIG